MKTSTGVEKEKYVEGLETISKNAAIEGNIKQLYDKTKKLVVKYSKPARLVRDKEDNPNTEIH